MNTMTDPNHGNSIITRLRLIIEEMHKASQADAPFATLDDIREDAETLLPIANVDIEVIVLREAAAIINGRGMPDISNLVESVAAEVAAEMAAFAARKAFGGHLDAASGTVAKWPEWKRDALGGMGGGPTNPDKTGKTLRRVVARSDAAPWEQEATELMGLTVKRYNAGQHVQLCEDDKILAEWWPAKGTTMRGGKRGPLCATGEDLIAWLRSLD